MESVGADCLFGRSIDKHNLRYTELFADGDSKRHAEVENTSEDIVVEKKKCICHV